jgi:hypothetical protein
MLSSELHPVSIPMAENSTGLKKDDYDNDYDNRFASLH